MNTAKLTGAKRQSTRASNIDLLRRRLVANTAYVNQMSAIPKASRTTAQKKLLASTKEENAVYELILDIMGKLDEADQPMRGAMNYVAVWSRALTVSELAVMRADPFCMLIDSRPTVIEDAQKLPMHSRGSLLLSGNRGLV